MALWRSVVFGVFAGWVLVSSAGEQAPTSDAQLVVPPVAATAYVAALEVHTVEELDLLLDSVQSRYAVDSASGPVMMVLHGSEVNSFIVDNYSRYQSVVEKSKRLTQKGYVQIEICERWLGANNVEQSRLQPFVKTVENGLSRIEDLKAQNYTYF